MLCDITSFCFYLRGLADGVSPPCRGFFYEFRAAGQAIFREPRSRASFPSTFIEYVIDVIRATLFCFFVKIYRPQFGSEIALLACDSLKRFALEIGVLLGFCAGFGETRAFVGILAPGAFEIGLRRAGKRLFWPKFCEKVRPGSPGSASEHLAWYGRMVLFPGAV